MITALMAERFWASVRKGESDVCWEWAGSCAEFGHGQFYFEGQMFRAHRVAYELTYGSIPAGQCVLHRCDNPPCCNPAHLFLGTRTENNADRHAKGRSGAAGHGVRLEELEPSTKLTPVQIIAIRQLCGLSGVPQHMVAAAVGVSAAVVGVIVRNGRGEPLSFLPPRLNT